MNQFTNKYWNERVKRKDDKRTIRIDGTCYYLGDGKGYDKGFGGSIFYIEYFNGEVIKTNDLWYNGVIPKEFKGVLKDNAKFLTFMDYQSKLDNNDQT